MANQNIEGKNRKAVIEIQLGARKAPKLTVGSNTVKRFLIKFLI